jgi:nitroreductase
MDVTEAIESRIEVRSYTDKPVDAATKRAILEAGRLAPSGRNLQHWRFVVLDDAERLSGLADRSPTGSWVADAAFAIGVCTDPSHAFHEIDAGRAVTHMQLAAWEHGVGSCIYTVDDPAAAAYLGIPDEYELALVAAFGYPATEVQGRKERKPLAEVASSGSFGGELELEE